MLPFCQLVTFAECARAIEIIDSVVRAAQRAREHGWHVQAPKCD